MRRARDWEEDVRRYVREAQVDRMIEEAVNTAAMSAQEARRRFGL